MDSASKDQQSHTVSFLKQVLTRLAAFKLPPTPENFAWVYRQLQREHDLPGAPEYVNDLAILEHAVAAFDQLFVADAWLNNKLADLRELLATHGVPESSKRQQVKTHLEEIIQRKEELLYHLAESSLALKSSISEVVREIGKLSSSVGGFQTNLAKYQELVDNCHDISDARRVMALVAHDTKKLNESLYEHENAMSKSFAKLQESGAMILANLNQHAKAGGRAESGDTRFRVSPTALAAEALLEKIREPQFATGVLMVVELTDPRAGETPVRRFSELLATKLDRAMLLGYWGGSQFVFVMPNVGPARAMVLAREIGKESDRISRDAQHGSLEFAYGIAGFEGADGDAKGFYKAFEAAYAARRPMQEALTA